ncbi:Uncharacterized conserved protein, DUF2147 family [Marinobacter daqiaonensis]|uniref:Uncharacterized conserved protein, DUF2147 family n=1 Tax=Marinobacter daqiaonensis TaxID=650891 RepID=A0A1I6HRI6_9GAMM|nr:DUF2147 domain-containing protein [Marinobacter daqiaonensis]SFR56987.1 Uncharacterized conserved protein, DUF2147 family [Marinobacter daqiaonensis]
MRTKLNLLTATAVVLSFLAVREAYADPRGLWNTEDDSAQVQLESCGDELCGRIVWLENPTDDQGNPVADAENPEPELRDRPIEGLKIVWGLQGAGDGESWKDGKVYDPESGKTYNARITLEDQDTLSLRGYVGAPLFGRTSTWTRADSERAE